ncbi:MAG: hypothetical protein QQN63_12245 [Nitrosopumilus sp.]
MRKPHKNIPWPKCENVPSPDPKGIEKRYNERVMKKLLEDVGKRVGETNE